MERGGIAYHAGFGSSDDAGNCHMIAAKHGGQVTFKPLEILIVNDASKSSRRSMDRYAGKCPIIDLPTNVGLAASRNPGFRAARGKFIALVDDDDFWLPRKLEKKITRPAFTPAMEQPVEDAWLLWRQSS